MKAYLLNLYHEAKTKVTTYVALLTAAFGELINNWDQSAAIFPHWLQAQKTHLIAAGSLVVIWTRVRRQLKPAPPPTP